MREDRREIVVAKSDYFRWLSIRNGIGQEIFRIMATDDNPVWKSHDIAEAVFSAILNLRDTPQ